MDTAGEPRELSSADKAVLGTLGVLVVSAWATALWGSPEQSERGFRLLNFLRRPEQTELPPAE